MNKIFQYISYLTILASFILIGLLVFWCLYPYKPITFNEPHQVLTKEVKRGEHLVYQVNYCKNTKSIPTITKIFVDGIIYAVPEIVAVDRETGCNIQQVQMYVPKALPDGEFYVKISYKYQVNPLRSITVVTQTEKFTIK
jgi:hypothetical protein